MISSQIRKVIVLLSCTFLGLISGTLYLYSSYSPQFAKQLGYTVSDSSYIALIGSLGASLSGPFVGYVVDKRGYTLSLVVGGLSIICGYSGMRHQYDTQYSNARLSGILLFLVGMGSTFINSSCLKCCAVSFPSIRGVATALPLALYGLSAMFYSVVGSMFYTGETSKFLGFLVSSAAVIFLFCAPSVALCDREHSRLRRTHIRNPSAAAIEMQDLNPLSPRVSSKGTVVPKPVEVSGFGLFSTLSFWLLFAIVAGIASIGQMYIYSCGYIVKALLGTQVSQIAGEAEAILQREQQFQVSLISMTNCIGRISGGIAGDIITQSFHKSRTWLLFGPCIGLMVVQYLGQTVQDYSYLWYISLFTGLFYGVTFCLMPIIVGDIFGMSSFSLNWGIVAFAPTVPAFYLTGLFGAIYDSNTVIDETTGISSCSKGNLCYNTVFKLTFAVTMMTLLMITFLNYHLHVRNRNTNPRKMSF